MGHGGDMVGKPVSEEEVALALGFKDVNEMRRWDTEQGQKVFELENKLRTSESDARNFQWHGRRMMLVLEKVKEHLMGEGNLSEAELVLAIGVVTGKEVDWDNKLDWLKEHDRKQAQTDTL